MLFALCFLFTLALAAAVLFPATVLVFLAAAAGAGFVASHFLVLLQVDQVL
jgi:hypothetical protein